MYLNKPNRIDVMNVVMFHNVCRHQGVCKVYSGPSLGVTSYLKMRIAHTFRDLLKQRFLDYLELRRLDDVQNLLNFPQEHDLMISKEMQEAE